VRITIDDFGNKWIIANGAGIAVYNENGTLDDASDDNFKRLNVVQGAGGLPNNSVYAITKDRKGLIWVGTLEGIAVYASPGSVFSDNFADASCPVIDGFCLLRDQRVSTIAVDGANRKWLGTNTGVYVVNPQGNRLLEHYTTENSPLFSDEIRDIQIDPSTGEIFIGTAKGLISLMGDATRGKETSKDLYVFPNPIPYDYDGTVAITCSVTDAEVRITNVAGQLVRALDALGGQAIWDFRDVAGRRLAPGIYLAMVTSSEGKNAGIAKFVVLERP
ncbi:MAG TPA: Por secretion system protein, partial [Bacteroidetes bacterium]|nr:Por secretion system protein [Bacteroidota bacterium]